MANASRCRTVLFTTGLIFLSFSLLLVGCRKPVAKTAEASKRLHDLLSQEWQYELKTSPETATALGDNRYNAELSNYSPAAFAQDADRNRGFLRQFEQLDQRQLSAEDELNRTLMIRRLRDNLQAYALKTWEMPVTK